MGFADSYLAKQIGFSPFIAVPPSENLRFIVVIPAYCEPEIIKTLQSLCNGQRPGGCAEVIIVFNSPLNAGHDILEMHRSSILLTHQWITKNQDEKLRFFVIEKNNIPEKEAGAGLARKTGMDEAVSRFSRIDRPDGFILSLDADSICDSDYLTAIEQACDADKKLVGFTTGFEHPTEGKEFPKSVYEGITLYELHLRYYKLFLQYIGFPYAFHTIGSCFGVKAKTYAAQGGMNRRKAGEDFYFLHKIIPLGHFSEIHSTSVVPSPRPSMRVPFGTGPAIEKYMKDQQELLTYNPDCFIGLRSFFAMVPLFYKATDQVIESCLNKIPVPLKEFIANNGITGAIQEMNANSASVSTFTKRFYRWFDAFKIVKYLNFASHTHYNKVPVTKAVKTFLPFAGISADIKNLNSLDLLLLLRKLERGD